MRILRRLVGVMTTVVVTALVGVIAAVPAGASCVRRPPVIEESTARAGLVFVGTAVDVTHSGRWATFAIEDIWKGEPDGDRVEVRAGPENGSSSVDRTYVLGTRYLVFAIPPPTDARLLTLYGKDVQWTDNNCSFTQPYTPTLAESRPSTARLVRPPSPQPPAAVDTAPSATPPPTTSAASPGWMQPGWLLISVAAVGALGAFAIQSRRRRSAQHR